MADELVGAFVLRCGRRVGGEQCRVAGGVEDRSRDVRDSRVGLQRAADSVDRDAVKNEASEENFDQLLQHAFDWLLQ